MVDDFKKFVAGRHIKIDEDAWAKDVEFIRAMIRFEIDLAVFDAATARQHLLAVDPQARYALGRFDEAVRLSQLSRKGTNAKVGQ